MKIVADVRVHSEWCNDVQLIVMNQLTQSPFSSFLKPIGYLSRQIPKVYHRAWR
jgi:hypothetical protein